MGNNIRIGKDFNVQWAINKVVDGERLPYDLVGKELQLYIVNDNGRKEVAGWKVQGNVIEWTYLGKDQRRLGAYQLVLVENAGKEGMVTVDTCKAFNLVEHSCEENVDGGNGIVIKTVTLESDVALAPVVKEVGGGASEEDIQEIKNDIVDLQLKDVQTDAKLTELSEETEVLKEAQQFTDVAVKDLQDMKIDRENDDYYPKMAVGLADNLAGVDVVDSEINFRRSGGGAISDGVARIESIKGNSVVWNQLMPKATKSTTMNGVTFTVNADGSIVANGTASATAYIVLRSNYTDASHKYAVFGTPNGGSNETYYFGDGNALNDRGGNGTIANGRGGSSNFACRVQSGVTANNVVYRPRLIDLTKMFGAGNEPTTIEEFYARIPMGVDLNAYNEGEVIHMAVQSLESVGVNQWDEEWEEGKYNASDGTKAVGTNQIRNANLIPILPNTEYYLGGNFGFLAFLEYGADKKFLRNRGSIKGSVKSSQDCHYLAFYTDSNYGLTYNHDICINLSDTSINDKYYPYIKRVEDLSLIRKYFPEGMRSAGAAHDEIRYNKESGKWEKVEAVGVRAYQEGDADNAAYLTDGKVTCYPLAEPIVTELDAEDQFKDLDYQVWNGGTEKAIAEGKSAPLAADITYGFNAIGKIKELESLVAALRAKVGI